LADASGLFLFPPTGNLLLLIRSCPARCDVRFPCRQIESGKLGINVLS
jgi:hypothetical protein